jgi:hypothetical protein
MSPRPLVDASGSCVLPYSAEILGTGGEGQAPIEHNETLACAHVMAPGLADSHRRCRPPMPNGAVTAVG